MARMVLAARRDAIDGRIELIEWLLDVPGMDPGGENEDMDKVWDAIEARIAELKHERETMSK